MSMFIVSANTNTPANPIKVVTAKDIAEKLGVGLTTIHNCLTGYTCGYAQSTVEKIRATAKEMGYDPKKARGCRKNPSVSKREKPKKHYWGGNFYSHEEEVARMSELRNEGFSNAEIAKKIGRTYECVLNNIGKQPVDMSRAKMSAGQHIRWEKEARRKAYVQSHKVVEHNELVRQVNEVGDKLRTSMAEMNTLRQTHEELVAKVAAKEADIRKVAEKMGMTVVEVTPIEIPMTDAKAETPVSFLN